MYGFAVHVQASSVSVGALIAICMQSAVLMTLGKAFFVLKIYLRQLHNNNNNNKHDNVYGAVIMAEPLREFTQFI